MQKSVHILVEVGYGSQQIIGRVNCTLLLMVGDLNLESIFMHTCTLLIDLNQIMICKMLDCLFVISEKITFST